MVNPHAHQQPGSFAAHPAFELTPDVLLDGDAVLGKPDSAWCARLDRNLFRNVAADFARPVERVLGPVDFAAGIPRLFLEISFLDKFESIRAQAFETSI